MESEFHKKRRTNAKNVHNPCRHSPKEDDYFILGRTDERFTPTVAYRNRFRHRSAQSSSPIKRTNYTLERTHQKDVSDNPTKVVRTQIDLPKRGQNEAVQTEGPRTALENEIKRIRMEIEGRKQRLCKQEPKVAMECEITPSKLKLDEENDQKCIPKLNAITPHAPRPLAKCIKDDFHVAGSEKLQTGAPLRQRNSNAPIRLTEYQRAYQPPEFVYTRKMKPVQQSKIPRVNLSPKSKETETVYDTEYRCEYKPFKYLAESQLKTTFTEKDANMHIVPLPRPKTAFSGFESRRRPSRRRRRSLTPPAKKPVLTDTSEMNHRRYQSEYNAQYRNFFEALNEAYGADIQATQYKWPDEYASKRDRVEQYRQRNRNSHFVPEHLAQLQSNCLNYWDLSSDDRYAENRDKHKTISVMPPAGKKSVAWCIGKNGTEPDAQARMQAMLQSNNVARVFEQDTQQWSMKSDRDVEVAPWSFNGTKGDQIHPRLDISDCQPKFDRPINSDLESLEVTSLEDDCTFEQEPVRRDQQYPRKYEKSDYASHSQSHCTCDNIAANLITCENSPLSARSMMSNASLASDTLERARKQRDLMFNECKIHQTPLPYSPCSYSQARDLTKPIEISCS